MRDPKDIKDYIEKVIDSEIPQIYFNSYINIGTDVDILTVLQRYGKPIAILNIPWDIARQLAPALTEMVAQHDAKGETRQ